MRRVAVMSEIESKFTGMFLLLARVLSAAPDGRLRQVTGPDMGYAVRRPRHA